MIFPSQNAIRSPTWVLLLLMFSGCLIALGFHTLLWSQNPLNHHPEGLLIIWAGFLGVLFLCKSCSLKKELCESLQSSVLHKSTLSFWTIVLGLGVLFRVQVLLAEPYLADDYQRYLFDGKLILAGINPYAVTPLSFPELGGANIPKPDVKTIYPPLAEGLFAVASWLGGTLLHWRLLNLIPDLLGATIFYRLLRNRKLPGSWIVLWLWNPLILKEGLHAAHLDIWTLFAVLLFVYWAQQRRLKMAALALGAAVLLKLAPLVLLPAWLTQLVSRREQLVATSVTFATVIVGFAGFLPWHPFGNLMVFLQHIQGYGVLFQLLGQGLGILDMFNTFNTGPLSAEWIKWLLTSLGGALLLYWVFVTRRYQSKHPSHLPELFLMLFVFSSMGFPWYLLAALPWVLMYGHWLWMLFVALSQLVFYTHQLQAPSTMATGTMVTGTMATDAMVTGITLLVLLLAVCLQKDQQKDRQQKVTHYV